MEHQNSVFEPFDPHQSVPPNSGQVPRDDHSPGQLIPAPPVGLKLLQVQGMSKKPREKRENVSSAHSIEPHADGKSFPGRSSLTMPGEQQAGAGQLRKDSHKNDPQKLPAFQEKIGIKPIQ